MFRSFVKTSGSDRVIPLTFPDIENYHLKGRRDDYDLGHEEMFGGPSSSV